MFMLKILNKKNIENLLNSFSGDYKELYLEKCYKSSLELINDKIEPLCFVENEWFSVLSRSKNITYFKSNNNLNNIKNEVLLFKKTYWLNNEIKKISLKWESKLFFKKNNLLKDIKKLTKNLEDLKKIISKYSFIKSYNIFIILSYKDYIVANSKGFFNTDFQYYNTFYITLVWEKNNNIEEINEQISWIDILNLLQKECLEKKLQESIIKLENILNWIPSPTWEMDIVISNESGWVIIHEAIWHWLEADLLNSSIYKWKLWKKVAKTEVNIIDDPTKKHLRWFYSFDSEWTKSKKTYLIKKWILVSYLHNNKTAEIYNTKSTWHWRRQNYTYTNLVRMWVTYLDKWINKPKDVIKKVKNGIYVYKMWWGQVNPITWDFIFNINYWRIIKNWKLWEFIRWWNVSWNWPKILKNIKYICDDLNYFDNWTCGKWQLMPVSDWNPTILVKLKVTGKN